MEGVIASPSTFPLYPPPIPSLPFFLLEADPLNPARGSVGALLAPPTGSAAEPQPKSKFGAF